MSKRQKLFSNQIKTSVLSLNLFRQNWTVFLHIQKILAKAHKTTGILRLSSVAALFLLINSTPFFTANHLHIFPDVSRIFSYSLKRHYKGVRQYRGHIVLFGGAVFHPFA